MEAPSLSAASDPPCHGLLLFVGYLTSQQHASVSLGRICSANFTCCHASAEIEVADQTFHCKFLIKSLVIINPQKSWRKRDPNSGSSALEADALTTRPTRWPQPRGRRRRLLSFWFFFSSSSFLSCFNACAEISFSFSLSFLYFFCLRYVTPLKPR